MKKRNLLLALAIAGTMSATAQVRIGGSSVPNPSALLDLNPDDQTTLGNATLGLALPRVNLVTTVSATPLAEHIHGMTVFNMATQNDVTPGIYYNDGSKWLRLSTGEVQLPNGVNNGDMFVWNASINQWEAQPEKDGVVGNEVENATDESLTRSGAGTSENPYTLAVSAEGIETKHLKDDAVVSKKIANNTITTEKIVNKAVTPEKLADNSVTTINIVDNSITNQKIVNKTISKDKIGDDVWLKITNEINDISFVEADSIIGNEVSNATDGSLSRSGAGTSVSPYTLAVALGGVENKHLKDGSITNNKIVDKTISNWLEITNEINSISLVEADSVIGNEVSNATDGSLSRSGAGTSVSPYTLAVALGGVENKHLKDGSITNNKIVDKTISNISFTEIDGVVGNEVTNATDGSLARSGAGTSASPYTLAVAVGGVENKHLKDGAVTTEKIANSAITTQKVTNKSITKEKLGDDVWNEVRTEITNSSISSEVDGIIGNEVIGSADASLTRSGSGTAVAPYRLAVSAGGIETIHLKDGAVTTNKIVNNAITTEKVINNAITKEKLGSDVWTEIIQTVKAEEEDGIVGNEVTNATDGSLTRSGSGTLASPYTLAVTAGGIESKHLKDGAVTTEKIVNNAITTEKVINNAITKEKLGSDVWTQIIQTIKAEEEDGIVGNEVTNATDGSLTRSGSGTLASPYTLAVTAGGIESKHLKDGAVTTQKISDNAITVDKLADAQSSSILYTDGSNNWTTFTRKVASGVFYVPNDSSLTRCALSLPNFGTGLYGIHIVCDTDLPMPEGDVVPSLFRFITDVKPYGVAGTRDLYFDGLAYFSNGDSHTTTAWLYDCKPLELELYCRNDGTKPINFRIVCTWLMPF